MAQIFDFDRRGRVPWLHGSLGAALALSLAACGGESGQPDIKDGTQPEANTPEATTPGTAPSATTKALPYSADKIIVRLKKGVEANTALSIHSQMRTQVVNTYRSVPNLQVVSLPEELSVEKAIELYRKDPRVAYAEPNFVYELHQTIPDDEFFADLFGMHNEGQTGGTVDADIDAPEAWDLTTGSPDVILGLLDTGFDYNHEDLAANAFVNPGEIADNGLDDDGNGFIDDVHGIDPTDGSGDPIDNDSHGSHVSGTMAGAGNNGVGVAGVNWEAKIVACAAFTPGGAFLEDILVCMDYFLDLKTRAENPVNIIATNNSWGGGGFSQALFDAIEAHNQAGMLFVASAGNSSNDNDANPAFPATYPNENIISVLATDHDDEMAFFSSFGASTVDVGAPGLDVLSTVPGNDYAVFSGTSMAAPHTTGLVGLLKAQDPSRTPEQIKNLILTGGDVTNATDGFSLSARRINAFGSLTCVDAVLENRFAPASDEVLLGLGESIDLGILSIACDAPSTGEFSVTVQPDGVVIPLIDEAGDGQFTGEFVPPGLGDFTLEFSNGDIVTVSVIGNYEPPRVVEGGCIDIEGTELPMGDDTSVEVISEFPIPFAGASPGITSLFVGSNGTIGLSGPFTFFGNGSLPTTLTDALLAPFWDDLNPTAGGVVSVATIGEAPERQLVVEWSDVPHFPATGAVTFQAVLSEASPTIQYNYCDVIFDDAFLDNGGSATIGVQINSEIAQQFSFNTPSVEDGQSLIFVTAGTPFANAGSDQVVLPGVDVVLDGSASDDSDGVIVSHTWTQVGGEPVDLIGADSAVATFTSPNVSGVLTFRLDVEDDEGKSSFDTVDVVVNFPPVADAGEDFLLAVNVGATLDGTASVDPDGTITGFQWAQLSGDEVEIANDGTPLASFTAPADPQYLVFQLTVTDDLGFTDSDVVVVETFANNAPLADAGTDVIVRPDTVVTLDGSASSDSDGSVVGFSWDVALCVTIDGPCELTIDGADTATPSFTAPSSAGLIHIALTVTDDVGATSTDSVVISVFRQAPTALIAGAGECASTGSIVTVDGTASFDPDGTIVSFAWAQVSGPAITFDDPTAAIASFEAPAGEGTVVVSLTVTDDDGLTDTAEFVIELNTPPVAVASASALAALAGDTVTLDGSASTDAATFSWVQVAGTPAEIADPSAATTTFVAPAPDGAFDILVFELTVTDECGASNSASVSVVVVPGI